MLDVSTQYLSLLDLLIGSWYMINFLSESSRKKGNCQENNFSRVFSSVPYKMKAFMNLVFTEVE